MELTIKANSADELVAKIKSLAAHFAATLPAPKEVVDLVEEKPKEEKKTKAKKETKVEAKEETKEETQETAKEEKAQEFTKQDIANACQKVSETKDLAAAKAILATFTSEDGKPCRRISDVKVVDYAAFIAKCQAELK